VAAAGSTLAKVILAKLSLRIGPVEN